MNIKEQLISVFNTFDIPYYLQGTMTDNEPYPERFITFFVYAATDAYYYNDEGTAEIYGVSIMYYDIDPERIESFTKNNLVPAMRSAGFIKQGNGTDILSDEPTHTGKALDFIIRNNEVY